MQLIKKVFSLWDQFWFGPQDLIQVSLFRMVFGGSLFVFYLIRHFDLEFQFSEKGLLPYLLSRQLMPDFYSPPIAWSSLLSHPSWVPWIHAGFLLLILVWALGGLARFGRIGTLVIFILHLAFSYRNPMVIYGSDMVASCWLLYLCFIETPYFRVNFWKWNSPKSHNTISEKPIFSDKAFNCMGIRFLQVQLCIIYAYSGLEKARGVTWWRGDAIWNALSNGQIVAFDLGFIHHLPTLLTFMCFGVLLWEVYFPVLVWIGSIRRFILTFGCVIHLSIGFLMGLPFFAIFMVSAYLLFIDAQSLRRWIRKRPWLLKFLQFSDEHFVPVKKL